MVSILVACRGSSLSQFIKLADIQVWFRIYVGSSNIRYNEHMQAEWSYIPCNTHARYMYFSMKPMNTCCSRNCDMDHGCMLSDSINHAIMSGVIRIRGPVANLLTMIIVNPAHVQVFSIPNLKWFHNAIIRQC